MRLITLAATAAFALSGMAHAASLTQTYSSFFAFGDSLSDTGNLFAATPLLPNIPIKIPSGPYVDGRFSNGPIWADSLIAEFTDAGLTARGFAFGLATASFNGPVPDFDEQRALFSMEVPAADLGARPLASVWFGANDLFGVVDAGVDEATAAQVGAGAALETAAGVLELAAAGIDDFLLFNLPDLGLTPSYNLIDTDGAKAASAGSAAFNAALDVQIAGLRAQGLNVALVDIDGLFDALVADPSDFGLTNAVDPCLLGDVLSSSLGLVQLCDSVEGLAFWDSVHPTTAVHAVIAREARAALAPVPLPAGLPLLALALAGLVVARARRRA